jgi:hypothetical protein
MCLLSERYSEKIRGVLSSYNRIVIHGSLPLLGNSWGMTAYLKARHIRIFDYPRFAEPCREELRDNAERLASENGLKIEFVRDRQSDLQEIYGTLTRTAIHTVKPDNVATFLGRLVLSAGLRLKELFLVRRLAAAAA